MERKKSKALKIISIVLVLSLIASLSVFCVGAADKYRVAVFTKDAIKYGKISSGDKDVEHKKWTKANDDPFYTINDSGEYNRIDYHRIDTHSGYYDDSYKIFLTEGQSINAEAGVVLRSALLQTGGFSSIPKNATVKWQSGTPGYVLKLEPDPNDSSKCKITALDSSIIDADEYEWLKSVIKNINPKNEDIKTIKNLLLSFNLEALDVNSLIKVLTVIGNMEGIDEKYASACLEVAKTIEDAKELKLVADRCITLEYTDNGKTDSTTIMFEVENAKVPAIKTYILNSQDGFDINTDVKVGDTIDLNAKVLPLRFNLGVVWSLSSNTAGATIDQDGKVKFNNAGKVTVVASPDLDQTFETAGYLYDLIQSLSGKIGNSDTALDIIITVLGLGNSQYKNLFKTLLKLYLKFIANENISSFVRKIGVKIGNFVLKLACSDKVTFNVTK